MLCLGLNVLKLHHMHDCLISLLLCLYVCQLTLSGQTGSVAVCDESSVSLECLNDKEVTARITFRARLSDLPIKSLPDLHDIGMNTLFSQFLHM